MNKKIRVKHIIFYIILVLYSGIQIFPFYLRLINSLQAEGFIPVMGKLYLWPENLSFSNYAVAWKAAGLGRGYINSLIYVTLYTSISAIIVVIVGYVLAKKKFKGRKFIFFILISTMMVPGEILFIPNYLLLRDINLLNKLSALIVPGLVNTFGIFLAKQFFMTIPDSILESAHLDGASELTIIRKIIFPLAGPVIATYFIITYTTMWNEYIWPKIVLTKSRLYPVQLALHSFDTDFKTPYYDILNSAGMIMTFIPVVIVFLIFQKKFVEGISLTGIK
ncbi:MAG: carbohydrate ABC transporter permease [Clostridia bacterium]|nr:carbohydrate ABC transporter permease [Clostridia bacterium]